jgi:carboxymethylenebutenolidase
MAREHGRGRAGSDVELDLREAVGGEKAAAYHAVPASERGRGVLVLDESGALGDFGRDACDRLARAGFAALAPDLPAGGAARPRIDAAVRFLLDDQATDGPRVGVLGFEEGAIRLFEDARGLHRIGCIVACGSVPSVAGDAEPDPGSPLPVPMLLLIGEQDERAEEAREVERGLSSCRLLLLPGAAAGFMNPARADRHDAGAAASAWDAALAFLEASL